MGDRGNVKIKPTGVYLYSHWNGYGLPEIVGKALGRRERWNDPSYLARIIFDEMTNGEHGGATGFGIDTEEGDSNNPLVIVDCDEQEVSVNDESRSFDSIAQDFERSSP